MRRTSFVPILLTAAALALAGCSSSTKKAELDPFAGQGSPYYKGKGPVPYGGGRYHVGKPYQVAGRWFEPKEQPNYDKTGTASWYGEDFNRRRTSNGEYFDMNRLTAAHATLPLPSYVLVTNTENNKQVVVRVNDRGPFVKTRVIDVSKMAAHELGFKQNGTATVRVQYIGPAPLEDNKGRHLLAMNREIDRGTPMKQMIASASKRSGTYSDPVQVAEVTKPAKKAKAAPATEPVVLANTVIEKTPPPASSGIAQDYYVQVGSFTEPKNAEKARKSLAAVWPVQVVEVQGQSGSIYRVRIGPITGEADARTALDDAFALGHPDAHIVVAHTQQAAL